MPCETGNGGRRKRRNFVTSCRVPYFHLSLKVWKDGDPEPASPQPQITDSTYVAGVLGPAAWVQTGFVASPTQVNVTYDGFSFTAVPEPSSGWLMAACFGLFLGVGRKGRK